MAKLMVVVLCAVLASVLAEPPSSYLPPQARRAPAAQYGVPARGGSSSTVSQRIGSQSFSFNSDHSVSQISAVRGAGASFGGSSGFGGAAAAGHGTAGLTLAAPAAAAFAAPAAPALTYGAPSSGFASGASFGASRQSSASFGSASFGAGASGQSGASFGGAAHGASFGGAAHGASFSAGASRQTAASFGGAAQGASFGGAAQGASFGGAAHGASSFGGASFGAGASRFSSASFGGASRQSSFGGFAAPAPVYGPPSARQMEDDQSEPANYEYQYQVSAAEESGAAFGHQESRENENARGQYHVLLPDGRMQIVEYQADDEGFKPVIRYQETGAYPSARGNAPAGPY